MKSKVTVRTLQQAADRGEKITMVTAYDATFARLIEAGGVDAILVGDSVGNVVQGRNTTLGVTLEHMIYHTASVSRGISRCHLVGDMPFMTYHGGDDLAMRNAGRLMAEGGAHAVKLEGGRQIAELVARMTAAGMPVMGHLGLTPQSVHQLGGYRVQARAQEAADRLCEDAHQLEEAGAYALVLEMVPADLAARVTEQLTIPTIGIGAGPHTSGQVLVCYDLLGMDEGFTPKFLKKYASLHQVITDAVAEYCDDVKQGHFPAEDHSF